MSRILMPSRPPCRARLPPTRWHTTASCPRPWSSSSKRSAKGSTPGIDRHPPLMQAHAPAAAAHGHVDGLNGREVSLDSHFEASEELGLLAGGTDNHPAVGATEADDFLLVHRGHPPENLHL